MPHEALLVILARALRADAAIDKPNGHRKSELRLTKAGVPALPVLEPRLVQVHSQLLVGVIQCHLGKQVTQATSEIAVRCHPVADEDLMCFLKSGTIVKRMPRSLQSRGSNSNA